MKLEKLQPPVKFDEFFPWLKQTSEEHWQGVEINKSIFGFQLQRGTSWLPGLSTKEIAEYEEEIGFSFPEIYKVYLKHMNGTEGQR